MTDRAVSDLVGFLMVFSLVVSVVAVVSVAGLDTLQSSRDAEQTNNAVRAFEVLSNNVEDVYRRDAPSRATEISLHDEAVHLDDRIQVEIRGSVHGSDDPSFLENRTFKPQPIVYDSGDAKLVYVMGAVFRVEEGGGTVVESWSPVLDEERTYLHVVNTRPADDSVGSIQSSTVLVRAQESHRVLEVANETASFDDVRINVTSPRRDLWQRMLDDDPNLSCSTAGPETVECDLQYEPERIYVVDSRIAIDLES